MGKQRCMDLDPRQLTTLAGYLEQQRQEKDARRRMREAAPDPYRGEVADSQKARRQIQELLESAGTDWDAIGKQVWHDD